MKEQKIKRMLKIYEQTIIRIYECELEGRLHGLLDQSKEDIEDYLVMLIKGE